MYKRIAIYIIIIYISLSAFINLFAEDDYEKENIKRVNKLSVNDLKTLLKETKTNVLKYIKYWQILNIVDYLKDIECPPSVSIKESNFYNHAPIINLVEDVDYNWIAKNLTYNFLYGLQNKDPRVRLTSISYLRRLVPVIQIRGELIKTFVSETRTEYLSICKSIYAENPHEKSEITNLNDLNEADLIFSQQYIDKILESNIKNPVSFVFLINRILHYLRIRNETSDYYVDFAGIERKGSVFSEFAKLLLFCERFYILSFLECGNKSVLKYIDDDSFSLLTDAIDSERKDKIPYNFLDYKYIDYFIEGMNNCRSGTVANKSYEKVIMLLRDSNLSDTKKINVIKIILKSPYKLDFLCKVGLIDNKRNRLLIPDKTILWGEKAGEQEEETVVDNYILNCKINFNNIKKLLSNMTYENDRYQKPFIFNDLYDIREDSLYGNENDTIRYIPDSEILKKYEWVDLNNI